METKGKKRLSQVLCIMALLLFYLGLVLVVMPFGGN